ncbi:hypothetical protein ALP39_200511 [Pseudomonas marginalis pv. marginalis]|nr:hypothetical protein ALP39_200511 [Pseudomonas marginalis pv. marginalis]
MLLASIDTLTPTAPDTSIIAPSRTRLRWPALTATWPPVARVIEPFWKSTVPPLTISMRDWSVRSATALRWLNCPPIRLAGVPSSLIRSLSFWLLRAVLALASSRIAVVLPSPRVMLPVVSLAELSK